MTTVRLSERGKDRMRRAQAENEKKGHRRIGEPGVHVEAMSYDRSNRDGGRNR